MTIEEVIYSRVTTELAGLIDTRCYPLVIPQDAPLPAIAYQIISSDPQISHDGPVNVVETRVQFTIATEDYAAAKEIDTALRTSFNGVRFTTSGGPTVMLAKVDNDLDDFDTADSQPFVRCDVMLWHTAA